MVLPRTIFGILVASVYAVHANSDVGIASGTCIDDSSLLQAVSIELGSVLQEEAESAEPEEVLSAEDDTDNNGADTGPELSLLEVLDDTDVDGTISQGPDGGGLCGWSSIFGAVEPENIDHARAIFAAGCASSYEGLICSDVTDELFSVFANQDGGAPIKNEWSDALFCKSLSEIVLASEDHLNDLYAGGADAALIAMRRRAQVGSKMTSLDSTVARKSNGSRRRRAPAPPPPAPRGRYDPRRRRNNGKR